MGRRRQSTSLLKELPAKVTITNPIHPMVGQEVEIRSIARRDGLLEVQLTHPDGGAILVPVWATNLNDLSLKVNVKVPGALFRPDLLLRVAEKLDFLRESGVKMLESCGEASDVRLPAQRLCSSSARSNPHGSIDDADSSISHADNRAKGKCDGGRP
jgi:hypothetical protein